MLDNRIDIKADVLDEFDVKVYIQTKGGYEIKDEIHETNKGKYLIKKVK